MAKSFLVVLLFLLAGCSGVPRAPDASSPCYANEASYECQVERYRNVNN
ncbi:MAG: hypothetical protein Q8Q73_11900 [Stagnimonas sp.]|nr:hypothetical protein [Stagnimonas sp.]